MFDGPKEKLSEVLFEVTGNKPGRQLPERGDYGMRVIGTETPTSIIVVSRYGSAAQGDKFRL